MNDLDLARLEKLEQRCREIAQEFGLKTRDVSFEIVTAQKMFELLAYYWPINYSHWEFGRDYERERTIYEHTGQGIPQEMILNTDPPRAFLVETNPLAVNILVMAHCFGHDDCFANNEYLKYARTLSNVEREAHNAAARFARYEEKYGSKELERIIDTAKTIERHQHPDPFFVERDEEVVRERILTIERALLAMKPEDFDSQKDYEKETKKADEYLRWVASKTPPEPVYDLLRYIINESPRPLKPWMKDVLTVIRDQARYLHPQRLTKLLNEGWATYWHEKIMERLADENLITAEEYGVYAEFHSGLTRENKRGLNWYGIGLALLKNVKERWDKGRFGKEYEECQNAYERETWDTQAGLGNQKLFEVRSMYTDRMLVEEFFTDDFIRQQKLYVYSQLLTKDGWPVDVIEDADPESIRDMLKTAFTHHGIPQIIVIDGDYESNKYLYLKHIYTGFELDPIYRDNALKYIFVLWGRRVYLEAREDGQLKLFSVSGDYKIKSKDLK